MQPWLEGIIIVVSWLLIYDIQKERYRLRSLRRHGHIHKVRDLRDPTLSWEIPVWKTYTPRKGKDHDLDTSAVAATRQRESPVRPRAAQ